jgi:hypothetical protein
VFELLVRRMRRRLAPTDAKRAGAPTLRRAGLCTVCESRRDVEARSAFWLSGILEDPAHAEAYANPGLLCFPHPQLVGSLHPPALLPTLLRIHRAAITGAAAALTELEHELERASAACPQDPVKALLHGLRFAVGHERDTGLYPGLGDESLGRQSLSVARFLESCRSGACPVCLEIRRAWLEWVRWLDAEAPSNGNIEDLLPTCPEHAGRSCAGTVPASLFAPRVARSLERSPP